MVNIKENKLKKIVKETGLKQDFIAEKIGIDRTELSAYINNKRTPTLKRAKKIADYFNLKIEELFFDN